MHERLHSMISRVFGHEAALAGDFGGDLRLVVRGITVARATTLVSLVQQGQRVLSAVVALGRPDRSSASANGIVCHQSNVAASPSDGGSHG